MRDLDRVHPSIADLEAAVRGRVPKFAYDYMMRGTGRDECLARNREALKRVDLVPEYLIESVTPVIETHLFGRTWRAPFGVAPVVVAAVGHQRAGIVTLGDAGQVLAKECVHVALGLLEHRRAVPQGVVEIEGHAADGRAREPSRRRHEGRGGATGLKPCRSAQSQSGPSQATRARSTRPRRSKCSPSARKRSSCCAAPTPSRRGAQRP